MYGLSSVCSQHALDSPMRVETLSLTPSTSNWSISCNNCKAKGWEFLCCEHILCTLTVHHCGLSAWHLFGNERPSSWVKDEDCCHGNMLLLRIQLQSWEPHKMTQNPSRFLHHWRRAAGWSSSWDSQWGWRSAYDVSKHLLNKHNNFSPVSTKSLQSGYESLSTTGNSDTSSGSVAHLLTLYSCLLFHRHSEFVPSQICQSEALLYTKKELLYPKITKQHALIFLSHSSLLLLSGSLIVTIFQLPIFAGGAKGSFLFCYNASLLRSLRQPNLHQDHIWGCLWSPVVCANNTTNLTLCFYSSDFDCFFLCFISN